MADRRQHQPSVRQETEQERKVRKIREEKQRQKSSTAQNAPIPQPPKVENALKRPTTFLCRTKFTNSIPEPVSMPKWIQVNQSDEKYALYRPSLLELNYKWKIRPEPDLGIPLDLLDPHAFNPPEPSTSAPEPLDPKDAALLSELVRPDGYTGPLRGQGPHPTSLGLRGPGMANGSHQKSTAVKPKPGYRPSGEGVSWLVNTQYIAPAGQFREKKKESVGVAEGEPGSRASHTGSKEVSGLDLDSEATVELVEQSFREAEKLPVHPTDPSLTAVEILPIVPDTDRLGDDYLNLVFDSDPLQDSKKHRNLSEEVKWELENRAIMKVFGNNSEEAQQSYVGYMIPSATQAVREQVDGETAPFDWIREYHWRDESESGKKSSFVFTFKEDRVTFVPVTKKLTVSKLKAKHGNVFNKEEIPIPERITVRKRKFLDSEFYSRDKLRNSRILEEDDVKGIEAHDPKPPRPEKKA